MTDIVERLRGRTMGAVEWTQRACDLCIEAADEIERLRNIAREAADAATNLQADVLRLRAALAWIANVNAMDYEYRAAAREALDAATKEPR